MGKSNMTMGRPKIEVDFEHVKKLCALQCTAVEIAGFLECSVDTLERRIREEFDCTFAEYSKNHNSSGKISLRRWQFKAAENGNAALLIWLGKQYLGQTDKVDYGIVRPTIVELQNGNQIKLDVVEE